MRVCYKAGSTEFQIDVTSVKEAFEKLSNVREVFTGEGCGCCKSPLTAPVCRNRDGFTFYEMKCQACGATLQYGQTKEGGLLFAKRFNKDTGKLPDNGWSVYKPEPKPPQGKPLAATRERFHDDPF